jgi:hypothetical protein
MRNWHSMLRLPKYHRKWYRDRLYEELRERRTAKTKIELLSETSDVIYILQRAYYDGFPLRSLKQHHSLAMMYMVLKYTSRWSFYRVCGFLANAHSPIREVINPKKDKKLLEIASRSDVDPKKFMKIACFLRNFWPFLP